MEIGNMNHLAWFLGIVVILLLQCFTLTVQVDCRQGIFLRDHSPSNEFNVTKRVHVASSLECAQRCQKQPDCETFLYRSERSSINCLVTNKSGGDGNATDLTAVANIDDTQNNWKMYTLRTMESYLCDQVIFCKNRGKCVADMCQPEGYSCICSKYRGKHCEIEDYNYDIVFPQGSNTHHVDLGTMATNLSALTLTCWIKAKIGPSKYRLLSYTGPGSTIFRVSFQVDGKTTAEKGVSRIMVDFPNRTHESYMFPVNDGEWHHVGYTWSSENGDVRFLIDGVLLAMMPGIYVGASIPSGGKLTIGTTASSGGVERFTRLNFWNRSLSGEEIEMMAKSPREDHGNVIDWFHVQDHLNGGALLKRPSQANRIGVDIDYSITLGTHYVVYPAQSAVEMQDLSMCTWFTRVTTAKAVFVKYSTQNGDRLHFGYGDNTNLVALIGDAWVSSSTLSTFNANWHFLCFTWNGESGEQNFYFDGVLLGEGNISKDASLQRTVQGGGNFTIGAKSIESGYTVDTEQGGTMSQLNVWAYVLNFRSIRFLSTGGVNLRADILAWGNLAGLFGGNVENYALMTMPGYTVLEKRTQWCKDNLAGIASCSESEVHARFGAEGNGNSMLWRCYRVDALVPNRWGYGVTSASSAFCTRNTQLFNIKD